MFVDASALIAILPDEADARALGVRLQQARRRMTSPLAVWETAVAVARILDLPITEARNAVGGISTSPASKSWPCCPGPRSVPSTPTTASANAGIQGPSTSATASTATVPARTGPRCFYKGDDFPLTDIEAG